MMFRTIAYSFALATALFIAGGEAMLHAQLPLGNLREYPITFTPAATAAAIGNSEQTITATGVTLDDIVYVNPPSQTALCPMTGARVSAANAVSVSFTTLTAVACTPGAGVYKITAIR